MTRFWLLKPSYKTFIFYFLSFCSCFFCYLASVVAAVSSCLCLQGIGVSDAWSVVAKAEGHAWGVVAKAEGYAAAEGLGT